MTAERSSLLRALLVAVAISSLLLVLIAKLITDHAATEIQLDPAQWHCVEYAPGAADCTVYRKVGTRAEDAQ